MTRALMFFLAVTLTAAPAVAQQRESKGAPSARQLADLYQRYANARDRDGIRGLVYWPGVQARERDFFDRSLEKDLGNRVKGVTIGPVPQMKAEYTMNGVTYRPTLSPIGSLVIEYVPPGKLTSLFTQYLLGTKDGRYYITLASPASR